MHTLVPRPSRFESRSGPPFVLTPATVVRAPAGNAELQRIARFLASWIGNAAGPTPPRVENGIPARGGGAIVLQLGEVAEGGTEAYELTVSADGVVIRGRQPAGVFYGVQTFRQLLPSSVEYEAARPDSSRPIVAPAAHVADSPRFPWRGAMLDVARHFFTVDEVQRYIDLMALHKLNRLHLHLSDDQGWRIEIASWPALASRGGSTAVGGGRGGYYSQAQYSALVSYARERAITIIPEIDVPGHTLAALASYGELACDGVAPPLYTGTAVGLSALCVEKEVTYRFIDDVVGEIAAITPGPYFHVGGDEVRTLTPQQYNRFIERVQAIVHSHGKQMVGWDEISSASLWPSTVVQHWRPDGSPADAVAKGATIVMSVANHTYLDMKYDQGSPIGLHWAGYLGVSEAYEWDPAAVAAGVPESALLGVEAPLWSETAATIRDVEWLAFPRLAAIAEVAWARGERPWDDFKRRLGAQAPRWSALGINFHRAPEIPWQQMGAPAE